MSTADLKEQIIQAAVVTVIETVNNSKDKIISEIVAQKQAMFDANSHGWQPLLPQTIERKKRTKDLFRTPESINIRKGDLFKAFTNTGSYKAINNNEHLDFDIELSELEQTKVNIVASHGRNAVEVTQAELNQITDNLTQTITEEVKHKYGRHS